MSFLGLTGKTYLVLGVANKKSVAWHVAKTLEAEGAKVVYSVRSQARLDSLKGLLDGKPVYLCDLEHEAQTQQLGPHHRSTLKTKGNLGNVLGKMAKAAEQNGACAEAADLYRAAADAYKPKYGKDDVDVVQCRAKARELGA